MDSQSNKSKDQETLSTSGSTISSDSFTISVPAYSSNDVNLKIDKSGNVYLTQFKKNEFLSKAKDILKDHWNAQQEKQTLEILRKIENLTKNNSKSKFPDIEISFAEDKTIGLTWKVADAILGIAISPDPGDSSWFLLAGEDHRGITSYGNLSKINTDLIFRNLVNLMEDINDGENISTNGQLSG